MTDSQAYVPGNRNEFEKRLWDTGDELRAKSKLKSSEYSVPVLGLIFLCYAEQGKDRSRQFTIQDPAPVIVVSLPDAPGVYLGYAS